ncbi:SDR family oxidoreductase [Desulfosediminicola flagellatus]|uniref:SDR family oxidoreductase n=1 Tax=Desulfosediminicola flagellatus TaxID=2569541 RepID=UPI0010ACE257|nr:SDR family oxidoreductase [Desulfosediminicola flagellatus]
MEKVLEGKVAIVTGASRGIGAAIAIRLGLMGANVVVNYAHSTSAALEVVKRITESGPQSIAVRADVRQTSEIKKMFAAALEKFGRLDILVNNAGILQNKPIKDVSEEEFDDIIALNVKSVFFACQEAAKVIADGGRIINISSTVTKMLLPTYGPYAATKGAVDQLTRVLAKELGHREVTVNSLSPGPVDTELFRAGKTEEQILQMAGMAALGRIGTPEDIADAVSLLVRDESGWISGQNICANGGMAG